MYLLGERLRSNHFLVVDFGRYGKTKRVLEGLPCDPCGIGGCLWLFAIRGIVWDQVSGQLYLQLPEGSMKLSSGLAENL